jgi:hypothetical protein
MICTNCYCEPCQCTSGDYIPTERVCKTDLDERDKYIMELEIKIHKAIKMLKKINDHFPYSGVDKALEILKEA